MKSKYELCEEFLNKNKILICPLCYKDLDKKSHALVCQNNHTFNITKKGTTTLLKGHYKNSKIYNHELFSNRRKFIKGLFYEKVYNYISNLLNSIYKEKNNINIIDIGCGEGMHGKYILDKLNFNYNYYGLDYSKDAIDMASDFNKENRFYFVSDVNNINVKSNSVDVIIDILSPFSEKEIKRILKKDGIFIKVAPNKYYLKELRNSLNIPLYENHETVENNINQKFKNINKHNINYTLKIDEEYFNYLNKMTPIEEKNYKNKINEITIDLIIYYTKKRN